MLWHRGCFSSCDSSIFRSLHKFISRFIFFFRDFIEDPRALCRCFSCSIPWFVHKVSLYNTVMKLVFIGTSVCIVVCMRFHKVVKQTYSKDQDTFRHYILLPPCFLLALLVHPSFTVMEVRNFFVFCFLHRLWCNNADVMRLSSIGLLESF